MVMQSGFKVAHSWSGMYLHFGSRSYSRAIRVYQLADATSLG